MAGIFGYIHDQQQNQTRFIVRRSPEIDAMLVEAGYNPADVNCVNTPLVGASDYARITVLVMSSTSNAAGTTPAFQNPTLDHTSTAWELYLQEPGGSSVSIPQYSAIESIPLPLSDTKSPLRFDVAFNDNNEELLASESIDSESRVIRPTNLGVGSRREEEREYAVDPALNVGSRSAAQSIVRFAAGGDGGQDGPDIGTTGGGNGVGSAGATAAVVPLNATTPRWMHWKNLLPTSIKELRRTAGSVPKVNKSGRPRVGDTALFVIEFVDYRYALQSIYGAHSNCRISGRDEIDTNKFRDNNGQLITGGMMGGLAINMLAETPNAYEAQTVAQTYLYPPNVKSIGLGLFANDPDNSGSIKSNAIPLTNMACASTYVQVPYSLDDILGQLAATVNYMTNGRIQISREHWDDSIARSNVRLRDDGDIVNLDFRGMTVAQALDTVAQRLGAAWVWDRSASMLVLQLASVDSAKYGVPKFEDWLSQMELHRVAGYINSLTLDIPKTVIVLHESAYCSVIGPSLYAGAEDAESLDGNPTYVHFVDSRSASTEGGFLSTEISTGLNTRAPMIWHTSATTPDHLSIDIKDHIPALIGSYSPPGQQIISLPGAYEDVYKRIFTTHGMNLAIGNTGAEKSSAAGFYPYQPWNYDNNTTPMALQTSPGQNPWGSIERIKPDQQNSDRPKFVVTLKNRKEIYEGRMERLRGVIDGDMTCNRMPPIYWDGKHRSHTPSVGLQYDTVEFGFDSAMTVRYRIFGKNTHPILYPSGTKFERSAGGSNVHAFQSNGVTTISVRKRETNNIKRSFLCRFEPVMAISDSRTSENNPSNLPFIFLYKFVEVVPDINAATMYFAQQDALGWTRSEGYALNLCEMHYRSNAGSNFSPSVAFDGTTLQLRETDSSGTIRLDKVYPTAPAGYAICYEIFNRAGFTSYYIFAQPGVDVDCKATNLIQPPVPWPYMGVSGAAKPTDSQIGDDIMGA